MAFYIFTHPPPVWQTGQMIAQCQLNFLCCGHKLKWPPSRSPGKQLIPNPSVVGVVQFLTTDRPIIYGPNRGG